MINAPPDIEALAAPKLDSVPFPEVMVSRCHAVNGTGLSFVLRALEKPKSVTIGFQDLKAGKTYKLTKMTGEKQHTIMDGIRPDVDGVAKVKVDVEERSEFGLQPVA